MITGSTAALLQGAPVPVDAVEIALRWRTPNRSPRWLETAYGQRWNARWEEFGGVWLEPEEPGEHRWSTRYGEIRATMCDELPETIEVRHGERSYRVVPLVELELTEPRAAELLRRYRDRQADGAAERPAAPNGQATAGRTGAGSAGGALPVDGGQAGVGERLVGGAERAAAEEAARVHRAGVAGLQHHVLRVGDQGRLLAGVAAPEQEDHPLVERVQGPDGGVGELLPARRWRASPGWPAGRSAPR